MPLPRTTRAPRRGSCLPRGTAVAALALAALIALPMAAPARADDPGWPRQFDSASGSIVIYQPQPEDLDGDVLTGRAAFSLQKSEAPDPTFGVLWFHRAHRDRPRQQHGDGRADLDVTKVRLPRITAAEASALRAVIEAEAAPWDLSGSLEELQAGLAATEQGARQRRRTCDNDPPRILFAYERAILVVYDGPAGARGHRGLEPPASGEHALRRGLRPAGRRTYYLNGANLWYTASDPLGPWTEIAPRAGGGARDRAARHLRRGPGPGATRRWC